jgi:archaellum biogenesis ATPase FlaH
MYRHSSSDLQMMTRLIHLSDGVVIRLAVIKAKFSKSAVCCGVSANTCWLELFETSVASDKRQNAQRKHRKRSINTQR